MTDRPLRRLADLPGIDALELKALMKPRLADPDERHEHPEVDETARLAFGLTLDEAEAVALPADWPAHLQRLDRQSPAELVDAFEAEGWDVTDDKRRPLRILGHFSHPLWLALRGVAGHLPFEPEPEDFDPGASSLAAEAAKFRRDKR
jgi:hypothetical protein